MWTRGKHHTEETKRKISEALKGEKSPWYGKHLPEEFKKKLSKKIRQYFITHPEARKKLSEKHKGRIPWNKGKKNVYSEETKRKMSEAHKGKSSWNKGKHHSLETRKKISDSTKGEKNWNWKGGIAKQHAFFQRSEEYKQWRKMCLERDNFTCQRCGQRGGKLHIHHILNFAEYPELRTCISNQ